MALRLMQATFSNVPRKSFFYPSHALSLPALVAGALLAINVFLAAPAQAQAPSPVAPTQIWQESFDDNRTPTPDPLTTYLGVNGEVYTADTAWLPPNRCNGWVVNVDDTGITSMDTGCNNGGGLYVASSPNATNTTNTFAATYLKRMAYVLGLAQGGGTNNKNSAVASMTNGATAQSATQFVQLSIPNISQYNPAIIPVPGHFYVASAMFAAVHCSTDQQITAVGDRGWKDPWENVNLMVNGVRVGAFQSDGTAATTGPTGSVCPSASSGSTGTGAGTTRSYTPPPLPSQTVTGFTYPYVDRIVAATLPAGQAAGNIFVVTLHSEPYQFPAAGTTLGLQINNLQTANAANDVAFDMLQLLDATPTLYKSFNAPHPELHRDGAIAAGKTGTLTFIVVNTNDLLEKTGWSFTDQLPNGVKIVADPVSGATWSTTCQTGLPTPPAAQVQRTQVTAVAGSNTINVVNGSIAENAATCTISVNVTADNEGVYVNDVNKAPVNNDGGMTGIDGLVPDPSGPAVLYVNNVLLTKTAVVTDGTNPQPGQPKPNNTVTKAGDIITYTFKLENHGTGDDDWLELEPPHLGWTDPQVPPGIASVGFTGLGLPLTIGNCVTSDGEAVPDPLDPTKKIFLQPLDYVICTATYTVVQDDIDAIAADPVVTGEVIRNSAIATADAVTPDDQEIIGPMESTEGIAIVPVRAASQLTLTKVASVGVVPTQVLPGVGKTVTYTVAFANDGNTTLYGVTLADNFTVTNSHGTPGTLSTTTCVDNAVPTSQTVPYASLTPGSAGVEMAPGYAITCTTNYTVTDGDTEVSNTAQATGEDAGGTPVPSNVVTVDLQPLPADITFTKTAKVNGVDGAPVTKANDTIVYTFTLTNNGPTADVVVATNASSLTDLFNDPAVTPAADGFTGSNMWTINCAAMPATLAMGESGTCAATYHVVQADIDNAMMYYNPPKIQNLNAAITPSVYPTGHPEEAASRPQTATFDVPVTPSSGLTLAKVATVAGVQTTEVLPGAGKIVTYTVTITNTGDTTLNTVKLTDSFTVNGTPPVTPPTTTCEDQPPAPGIPTSVAYLTLTGTGVFLAPEHKIVCTTQYTVVATDTEVKNTASITGKKPDDDDVPPPPPVEVDLKPLTANIAFTKTAKVNGVDGAPVTKKDDTIVYTFTLTNNGPTGVVVDTNKSSLTDPFNDPAVTPAADGFTGSNTWTINCAAMPATLTVGQSGTCTATYQVLQADIDNAMMYYNPPKIQNLNAAITPSVYPTGHPEEAASRPQTASFDVPVEPSSALTLTKEASIGGVKTEVLPGAGKVVTYTVTITNGGATTLNTVTLTDQFTGANGSSTTACEDQPPVPGTTVVYATLTGTGVSLAPGHKIVCTTQYTVDATDTEVKNEASVKGKEPGGDDIPPPPKVTVDLKPLTANIVFTKTAKVNGNPVPTAAVTKVNDTIVYTLTLKNNGPAGVVVDTSTLNLTDPLNDPANPAFVVTDDGFTGSTALVFNCAAMPVTLAVNQSGTCTATYIVTQTDIDNAANYTGEKILNTNATVTPSVYPAGHPEEAASRTLKASFDVPVTGNAALSIVKKANKPTLPNAGETVSYKITITNTGNETLATLTLTDTFSGGGNVPAVTCTQGGVDVADLSTVTMAPNDVIECTSGDYTVTAADVAAGKLTNTAGVMGQNRMRTATATLKESTAVLSKSTPEPATVPTLDPRGLALLILMLGALVWRAPRRQQG